MRRHPRLGVTSIREPCSAGENKGSVTSHHCLDQFLKVGILLDQVILSGGQGLGVGGAVLSIAGRLAASLTSAHYMPIAPLPLRQPKISADTGS